MPEPPVTATFNGRTFRRRPNSRHRSLRVYYSSHASNRKPPLWLHQEVWKARNGPIPKGHEIHHADGDPFNNAIENLECVTRPEHRKREAAAGRYNTEAVRANLNRIRPLAAQWHRSAAGRAWHSQNGKRAWTKRQPVKKKCEQCRCEFQSITNRPNDRCCSRACYAALRRASGVDDEERKCKVCRKAFIVNRFAKTTTCSRPCADRVRVKTRRGQPQ